jgi:hypothetical protein
LNIWALGVGGTLGRALHVGGTLCRSLGMGRTLGGTLDIGGTLSASAGSVALPATIGLEGGGGEEEGDGGDGEDLRTAGAHDYLAAVNLIGPSFGMGMPPLSRL